MERNFGLIQSGYAGDYAPATGVDEAYLNGCFSELSFQSILQPISPYDGGVLLSPYPRVSPTPQPAVETAVFHPATYDYFKQDFPAESSEHPNVTHRFLNKVPKTEVLNPQDFAFQLLKLNNTTPNDAVLSTAEPLINFFSSSTTSAVDGGRNDVNSGYFSLEPLGPKPEPPTPPRPQLQAGSLNDIVKHQLMDYSSRSAASSAAWMNLKGRYMPYKSSGSERQRRQRVSDKTRCLQKLLPWNKKMDMGTMLEEAYKYIKFLQAQIRALETMPVKTSNQNPSYDVSGTSSSSSNVGNDVVWGELGKLNRQQLLEVVVNSPVAQTVLYSRGCCVYSMEQLVLLQEMAGKKSLLEKLLFAAAASPLLAQY